MLDLEGNIKKELLFHEQEIPNFIIMNKTTLIAVSMDGNISVWDLSDSEKALAAFTLKKAHERNNTTLEGLTTGTQTFSSRSPRPPVR